MSLEDEVVQELPQIKLPDLSYISPTRARQIRQETLVRLVESGVRDVKTLDKRLHCTPHSVWSYARSARMNIATGERTDDSQNMKYDKAEKEEKLRSAIFEGASTRQEIVDKTGLPYQTVCRIIIKNKIEIKDMRRENCSKLGMRSLKMDRTLANELIAQGLALREIAEESGGVTGERVRQYINSSGQHEKWKEAKLAPKVKEKERKATIGQILGGVLQRAYENASWEEQRAFDYIATRKKLHPHNYDMKTLIKVFRNYKTALDKGKKVSLKKLSEKSGLLEPGVGTILRRVGLEPMVLGRMNTVRLSQEKKDAMKRAFPIEMSNVDIAYFLGVPIYTPYLYFHRYFKNGGERPKVKQEIEILRGGLGSGKGRKYHLTYRLASQIYESLDAGFNVEETAYLLDTVPEAVVFANSQRAEIGGKIKRALKTLYPDKKFRKPYVQRKD